MNYNEFLKPNKIIKSKRKSISLIITNNNEFVVRAPISVKDKEILNFINQKQEWIIKKRSEQLKNSVKPLLFNSNEDIEILGNVYHITLVESKSVKLVENIIKLPKINSKVKFISFLKKLANVYITKKAEEICSNFNFSYNKISINSAKTRWGSCSSNNSLNFTYKLMLCPKEVVDYVVLHELCHTKVKNHSSKYWELVKRCNPSYKEKEKWLKKNRAIVNII